MDGDTCIDVFSSLHTHVGWMCGTIQEMEMALKEAQTTADSRVEEEKAAAKRAISVKPSVRAYMSLHESYL